MPATVRGHQTAKMTSRPTHPNDAAPAANPLAAMSLFARAAQWCAAIRASDSIRDGLQRKAMFAFCVRIGSAALLYLSQIFLARWMGASEFGVYVLVWTWVLIIGGMSHLGLSMAMMRLIPEYTERKDYDLLRGLLRCGRLVALGAGTLVALAGLGGLWAFGHRLEPYTLLPAYLALVCVPLYALTDLQDGIGRGHGWIGTALLPPYILRPLVLLLSMVAAHAYGLPMTAPTAAAAAILATWTAALVQTIVMNRALSPEAKHGPRRYTASAWFKVSLPLLVTYAAELVLQNADLILLSAYHPPRDVGMYFAAAKTMALVLFVHYAVGSAVAHRFSSLNERGDQAALASAVRDAVRWTFYPSLAAAVLILAIGWPMLWLFSPEFTAAYPVMVILVIGFLARAAVGPAEFLLNTLGEQNRSALVAISAATLNVLLNYLLIPSFGLVGAATATTASLIAAAIANYVVARRRLGFGISIFENLQAPKR
jgi:O-antigen/teichoic acid export membrane protein